MMSLKERRDRRSRMVWVLRLRTPRWSQVLMTLLLQQATADLLRSMWYTLWSMTRMMVVTQLVIWGQTLRRRRRRTTRQPDTSGNAMVTTCLTAPSGHAGENVKVEASRLCGNPKLTQPHTLGMWSRRLGEVHSTSCGDLCRCTALAQMKCPECETLVADHWLQASKKVAETIRVKEQTVRDLLRDYMMTTMCRWNEEAGPVSRHLGAVLHELATNVEAATDISPPDISTSSSRRHRSKLVEPVEVAEKALGDTGAIDIPDSVWDAMAPANFLWASEGTPPQPFSSDPPLVALVHTLLGQQLVAVSPSQKPPNARAYVQHKNEHKCSLILPMLDLNARCVDPLPFKLPTLDRLAHLLQLCALRGEQLFYCTLDISNHFWSCRLPPPQRDSIRVGVGGRVYALQSLPFGWKHSPSMAQAILAAYLVEYFPGSVVVIQYADDVLVAGRHPSSVRQQALRTKADLEKAGWVVSPKSSLDPSDRVKWMGKVVGGDQGGVQNAPPLQAHLVCCWLRLATTGYSDKALRRMLGKLQWALRPGRGAQPFLAGAYRWLNEGPSTAKCTPPKVLRGLLEGIACALVPWVPHGTLGSTDTFYCDAARQGQNYYVGIRGDTLGMRIKRLPDWVATQQAAELAGIVETVRTGAYRRVQFLRIYGDNMSSLFSAMKGKATTACDAQNRLLRQLQHTLRWSGAVVELLWVKGELNPADVPSRWRSYESPDDMLVAALCTQARLDQERVHTPLHVGTVRYRG